MSEVVKHTENGVTCSIPEGAALVTAGSSDTEVTLVSVHSNAYITAGIANPGSDHIYSAAFSGQNGVVDVALGHDKVEFLMVGYQEGVKQVHQVMKEMGITCVDANATEVAVPTTGSMLRALGGGKSI